MIIKDGGKGKIINAIRSNSDLKVVDSIPNIRKENGFIMLEICNEAICQFETDYERDNEKVDNVTQYFILKVDTSRTQDISSYVYTCNMNSKEIIHIQDVVAKYSHQEQLVIYDFIKEIVE